MFVWPNGSGYRLRRFQVSLGFMEKVEHSLYCFKALEEPMG